MGAHISIPLYQRTLDERYSLKAYKCKKCGHINFPKKGVCSNCRSSFDFEEINLKGNGKILTYTVIAPGGAPPEFSKQAKVQGDYPVAIIEFDEGPKIVAQIVDVPYEELKIGLKVKMVLRKIYEEEGVVRYGYKFKKA